MWRVAVDDQDKGTTSSLSDALELYTAAVHEAGRGETVYLDLCHVDGQLMLCLLRRPC